MFVFSKKVEFIAESSSKSTFEDFSQDGLIKISKFRMYISLIKFHANHPSLKSMSPALLVDINLKNLEKHFVLLLKGLSDSKEETLVRKSRLLELSDMPSRSSTCLLAEILFKSSLQ